MAVGASGTISATNITNQNKAGVKQGSLINAAGDLALNAQDTVMNRSSDKKVKGTSVSRRRILLTRRFLKQALKKAMRIFPTRYRI